MNSSIYIHIPFCKTKCFYCDFYSVTNLTLKNKYINALIKEIELKKNFFGNENKIISIYFGGGTPSLLGISELDKIVNNIFKNYKIAENPEITIELNPDDIDKEYLKNLMKIGFNRISIGVQSFSNCDLKLMNRRHNSTDSYNAVKHAVELGFVNISVDLIYGLPGQTIENINDFFDIITKFDIPHISAYHITYEKNTVFYNMIN